MAEAAIVGNQEILQVADAVSREKGLDRESVIEALEQAIQVAGRRKYGHEMHIVAHIDRKTGSIELLREREVVDVVENPSAEISLEDAKERDASLELEGKVYDPLPPIDFGRVVAQTAKQVIIQKVRDAEREQQFEEFKDRKGEIISGEVKRVEYGNVVIDLGRGEAVVPRNQCIPREVFRKGDRIRAYIADVNRERSGSQVLLSRIHPQFVAKLFAQEVPEVYDGIIEIKAVARDPGSRAKVCVSCNEPGIDPVGSCVGVRGSRVQAVINELHGERIDIIEWTPDPASLVVTALSPAEVAKVVIDEDKHRIEVVVPDDQQSIAIGRRGQNVRLASEVVGWDIDILTEEDESNRRAEEFNRASNLFIDTLNVDDVIGQLLASEGFMTLSELIDASVDEVASVEGFDEDIAEELQARAREYMENREANLAEQIKEKGLEPEMAALPHLMPDMVDLLAEHGIKTRDDLGDLSRDEFEEIIPNSNLSHAQIDEMIMAARAHWFEEESANDSGDKAE